jgi:hypothetical protein
MRCAGHSIVATRRNIVATRRNIVATRCNVVFRANAVAVRPCNDATAQGVRGALHWGVEVVGGARRGLRPLRLANGAKHAARCCGWVYTHSHARALARAGARTHKDACMHARAHACMHVRMHVAYECLPVCFVCRYVRMHVRAYTCAYVCVYRRGPPPSLLRQR